MSTLVIRNARVLTADPARAGLGLLDHGAVVVVAGRVVWVGADADVDVTPGEAEVVDARGRLLTPGLVDCHTHLPFGGDRAREFALRAAGAGYLEIAAAGGGIVATVAATRAVTDAELAAVIAARARRAAAGGTTTIEAKSGYELTLAGERRCLAAIAAAPTPLVLEPTLLAHVVPPEARATAADRAAWVRGFADELVPAVAAAGLATSVDVYCDDGSFTLAEADAIWSAARRAGLAVRGHVGQFADLGGAECLAAHGARSADHLEGVSDAGIAALAAAGTVAVMIPTACVQLRQEPPPVGKLRAAGVALAVATDWNPGTSWAETLGVPMWLATTRYGMTVEEAWLGVTRHAATALGRGDVGQLTVGARADLALWDVDDPAAIPYRIGAAEVAGLWLAGAPLT
jgi:imidazolonepropionase